MRTFENRKGNTISMRSDRNKKSVDISFFIIVSVLIGSSCAWARTVSVPQSHPQNKGQNLKRYVDQYPSELLKDNPGIQQDLRHLLGSTYGLFTANLVVEQPIELKDNSLFLFGCRAQECDSERVLLVISLSDEKLHCAIRSKSFGNGVMGNGVVKIFTADRDNLPHVLIEIEESSLERQENRIEFQGCKENLQGLVVIGENTNILSTCINENCPRAKPIAREGRYVLTTVSVRYYNAPIEIYLPKLSKLVCIKKLTCFGNGLLTAQILVRPATNHDTPYRYRFRAFKSTPPNFAVPEIVIHEYNSAVVD